MAHHPPENLGNSQSTSDLEHRRDAMSRFFSERRKRVDARVKEILEILALQEQASNSRFERNPDRSMDFDLGRNPNQLEQYRLLTDVYVYRAQGEAINPDTIDSRDVWHRPPWKAIDDVWKNLDPNDPRQEEAQVRNSILAKLGIDTSQIGKTDFVRGENGDIFAFYKAPDPKYRATTYMVWRQEPSGFATETLAHTYSKELLRKRLRTDINPFSL